MAPRVLVVGGSGFIGSCVVRALRARGADTRSVAAPRLNPVGAASAAQVARDSLPSPELSAALDWAEIVVNAAGNSNAGELRESNLIAANAAMPAMIARLARNAGVGRFVHFSSAAVQGERLVLDASDSYGAFSPYSRSKVVGEELLAELDWSGIVIYRPQGVHGSQRSVTRQLIRVAQSPLASVAAPGDQPTPQALVADVADAAAFLALTTENPPQIVIHPWDGITAAELLYQLGGRRPIRVPGRLAMLIVSTVRGVGRHQARVASTARRLQMIWFGQQIAPSWLSTAGWRPTGGTWAELSEKAQLDAPVAG